MVTLTFICVVLFLSQLIIGIRVYFQQKNIPFKFNYPLTKLPDPATILENYMKIYRKIGIKVNAKIDAPALAKEDFILVKRDTVYDKDLFTNFYVLLQLELTKKTYNFLRNLKSIQNILFFSSIFLFILAIGFNNEIQKFLLATTLILQILTIFATILGYELISIALDETYEVAKDLLDLDELEQVRTQKLMKDLKYMVFDYPLDIPLKLFYFFSF
ncbi:MAG: hypothetical protein KatS3mg085_790 [Candidatus Dojkabacteria bacterium]|nr:MAG: hypothetical protein KatS3mg085_790 [Candidatus Dojkabacteria bacterium]GIW58819.1 MAG: hypothetical protein KatS3mg086_104 [Candidatus Dojkabacteria bacterium]